MGGNLNEQFSNTIQKLVYHNAGKTRYKAEYKEHDDNVILRRRREGFTGYRHQQQPNTSVVFVEAEK